MEVRYKRELNRNYLIVAESDDFWSDDYQKKMLEANNIDGFLKYYSRQVNGEAFHCFEISSKQPLGRLLEVRNITRQEIEKLLTAIKRALDLTEEYLLEERQILLDAEYIYITPEDFQVFFCLVPGFPGNFPEALRMLLQYLLNKVDYKDRNSVSVVYQLYQESLKENYHIKDLIKVLWNNTEEVKESAATEKEEIITYVESSESLKPTLSQRLKGIFTWKKEEPEISFGYIKEDIPYYVQNRETEEPVANDTVLMSEPFVSEKNQLVLRSMQPDVQADVIVDKYPFIIGKSRDEVNYQMDHPAVSRMHLKIEEIQNDIYITDLNSTNGTYINNYLLEANERKQAFHKDKIVIAGFEFELYNHG